MSCISRFHVNELTKKYRHKGTVSEKRTDRIKGTFWERGGALRGYFHSALKSCVVTKAGKQRHSSWEPLMNLQLFHLFQQRGEQSVISPLSWTTPGSALLSPTLGKPDLHYFPVSDLQDPVCAALSVGVTHTQSPPSPRELPLELALLLAAARKPATSSFSSPSVPTLLTTMGRGKRILTFLSRLKTMAYFVI